jgi:hypothetical protein
VNAKFPPHLGPSPDGLLHRDGFRLLSTRRIALPVWLVSINARLLRKRKVPAIDEFILRSVNLGIANASGIQDLLNLPREVVDGVLSNLIADRHVLLGRSAEGTAEFQMSPSGTRLTETLIEERPVERPVTFSISGITGEPIAVERNRLLSARELDDQPHLIVDLADDVELEYGPADTHRFIDAMPVGNRGEPESLLSLLSTQSTTKMYISAVALLFESVHHSEDLYLRVCVDGRSQDDLEEKLRESGVLSDMRLESRVSEDRLRVDRALGGRLLGERIADSIFDDLKLEVARRTVIELGESSTGTTSSAAARAQNRIAELPVVRLECIEAHEALQLGMSTAQAEILISTTRLWSSESVDEWVKFIRQLLNAGVAVNLEILADQRQMAKVDQERLAELQEACHDTNLKVWPTKAAHEANFVAIDGTSAFVFPNSPFVDIGYSSERLGDDRPSGIYGLDNVQELLSTVHERSTIPLTQPRQRRSTTRSAKY